MPEPAVEARVIRKARKARAPGRMVLVDLGDGRHAYGRQLWSADAEFYPGDPDADLLDVVTRDVLFTVWAADQCFQRDGRWTLLDTVPLLAHELERPDLKFQQDMISGALRIRRHTPPDDVESRPATVEECQALERDTVWSPERIESRLRDLFDGRSNIWVESLRAKAPRSRRF